MKCAKFLLDKHTFLPKNIWKSADFFYIRQYTFCLVILIRLTWHYPQHL